MKFLMTCLFALFYLSLSFSFITEAKTLQIMSYNVENLFDAKHDKDKKDWTFLPKDYPGKKEICLKEKNKHHRKECLESDWTEAKVDLKISQIHDVVTSGRELPEFLALVEVENPEVVARLAKKLGYENIEMSDSPDERGVDVALLYKGLKEIKKISRHEHIVPVDYPTRNILEVEFLINEKYPLTLFVNHWPSLANPDSWRVKAAEVLSKRSQDILMKNPAMAIVAMGDFNTIDDNDPHPFKTVLYKDNLFEDVENLFIQDKKIEDKTKSLKPAGTYYFAPKDQWNSLDHFFVNKVLSDGKDLDVTIKSFEIFSPPNITHALKKKTHNDEGKNIKIVLAPKRFEPRGETKESIGFSDHFPILVKLDYPDFSQKVTSNALAPKKRKK